jgi:hypothetical protein
MADKYTYYTPENMKDKRVSDLKSDPAFLTDAITFLNSSRKGYTEEDITKMSADDVVDEMLTHFRYQTVNEVTMSKDYYYINDDATPLKEREAFGRLMFAFDNAKGEGMFDRGADKILDYAAGIGTAPSTYASVLTGAFSGGSGGAAVQGSKAAALTAVREAGKAAVKNSLFAGAVDGSIAAASEYGNQRIRKELAPDIGEEYDISGTQVALSGALGSVTGAVGFYVPARQQNKAAERLVDVLDEGREAGMKRVAEATERAKLTAATAKGSEKSKKLLKYTTDTLLRSIDPRLVEEGRVVKKDIFSDDLEDGLIGGFDVNTIQRLSAASFELAQKLGVQPEKGQRITEFLAKNMEQGRTVFDKVAEDYGLTPRQLSAAYAAEISDAARLLVSQKSYVVKKGTKTLNKAETKEHLQKLSNEIDTLFTNGLSTVKSEDIRAIEEVNKSLMSSTFRQLKGIEDARRMFMTSQPATTMRNNIFSVAMTGIDMLDQLNTAAVRTLRRNPKASATATLSGTFDNFRYLAKDTYVADALVTMLRQQAPKQMHKVFYDAAIAESGLVKDTALAKVGAAANTLNSMSDYVFKRAVIAGNIDRQLKQLGNEELGTSVMDMLKKGTVADLPDKFIANALDEALAFTFQRRFGGKGASAESEAVRKAISIIHNYGITTLIPFPRYIASQAKFVSDYTGLTVIRRLAAGKSVADEELAKFMTGGALSFGVYYGVAKEKIANDLEWYEVEGPDGQPYNGQSAFGPLSAHMYVADLVARATEGYEVKDTKAILKDLNNILIGTEFRPGTGLTDAIVKSVESDNLDPLLNQLFDYFASYTYPAAVVKDFYGQFDPLSSYLPETRDASISTIDMYGKDVSMSVFQRVTRHLPDFNTKEMAQTLKEITGISIDPDMLSSFLEMASTSTYTNYQEKYAEVKGIPIEGYDAIRYDVFGDGPAKMRDPFMKQLTGFSGRPPKNALQREMTRLQIDPFKAYNPYSEKNQALEIYTQQKLQGNMALNIEAWMQSPAYAGRTNDAEKKSLLQEKIKTEIRSAREQAEEELKMMATRGPDMQRDYESYVRGEFNALAGESKGNADMAWSKVSAPLGFGDASIAEALDMVKAEEDLTGKERRVKATQLMLTYIDQGKRYGKFEKQLLQ